ncbi:hypothetical protein G7Y89_g9381 [Cudoniella acicularis]|uniref:Biogenesis of lysosome-related organelles complex 1 subunit CNL1 n=1 Tax=Cudoniella acicularis TaxID=354080 RepID=A0A8H4RES7_9HELO|nr:hypothetical protein G7Y89_g9381 [Cudoniella acicularis]
MSSSAQTVRFTQLSLTPEEIALLQHYYTTAFLSSVDTGRHFDTLLQQIQSRKEYLSEQLEITPQQQYDWAGNAIVTPDSDIAHFRDIPRQIYELELELDRIKHI